MLGDNIRKIRKSKRISINKLSQITKISLGYLSDLENNKATNPSVDKLHAIASALDVTVNDFFTTEEKLEMANTSMKKIHDMANEGLNIDKVTNLDKIKNTVKENKIETIAAHFEGEEFTNEDVDDIQRFIEYVVAKRKNKI